jgi:hypothetical protein
MTPSQIAVMLDVPIVLDVKGAFGHYRILVAFVSYSLPLLYALPFWSFRTVG